MLTFYCPASAVNQYCEHSSTRNCPLSFLNQQKGENGSRKHFKNKSPQKNVADLAGVGLAAQLDVQPTVPPRRATSKLLVNVFREMGQVGQVRHSISTALSKHKNRLKDYIKD